MRVLKIIMASGILSISAIAANVHHFIPIIMNGGITIYVDKYALPDTLENTSLFTLKGEGTINLTVGDDYTDAGVTVTDNRDVNKSGYANIFKPDTYTIQYTAENASGKKTEIARTVIVHALDTVLPYDTNLQYAPANEKGYLYFADPQPEEHGKNRVIRVNYDKLTFHECNDSVVLTEDAYLIPGQTYSNPHSVDRAGKTNKFYVRTQNAYSFDVIAVENGKLVYKKTVPLSVDINGTEVKYSPRAFGAYNAKYDIQLLSGRNSPGYNIVSIVDVKTDQVLKTLYKSIDRNGSTVTGHAKWLNKDYFAMIDRGNHSVDVYKVFRNDANEIDAKYTGSLDTITPLHAIERVPNPKNKTDLNTFYLLGASADINGSIYPPFVRKVVFNPKEGKFDLSSSSAQTIRQFTYTDYKGLKEKHIAATTHHAAITADGKYIIVPVSDGKIYKVDRETMKIVACINTGIEKGLGAGHIVLSEPLHLAVVTNHWSPYITLIDTSDNHLRLKGYVKIYRDGNHDVYHPDAKHLMQPHFAQLSKDGKYFYTFASQDNGRFVKVNLEEVIKHSLDEEKVFEIDNNDNNTSSLKSVDVGGAPEQAHS